MVMDESFHKKLLEIVKVLPKIRGKSLSYHWSDGAARDYFTDKTDTFYRSLSFRVSDEDIYRAKSKRFQLSSCNFTSTGVVFSDNCTLDVCFDDAFFLNQVYSGSITISNSEDMDILLMDSDGNTINLKEEQITEEWIFQLMTRYDIPPYEELSVLKEMRKAMMQYDYPYSFSLLYNNEEDLNLLLEKVQEFLNDQN